MNTMVSLTAGVRLVFATDSSVVELTTHPRSIHLVGSPVRPPVFQMLVDGALLPDAAAAGGTIVHIDREKGVDGVEFEVGGAVTVRWDDLGDHRKSIEIWMPTDSSIELHSLRVADAASVEAVPVTRRRWTHYGSSISHCMDVDRPFDAWPVMVARANDLELTDLGLAGQCQLDPFMGSNKLPKVITALRELVRRDLPADVISVKLGINLVNAASMTERTFGPAVHGLLDHIRDGHPATPLLVVSPIYCGEVEHHPGPTVGAADGGITVVPAAPEARPLGLTLTRIREMLADIVAARRAAGDEALAYLDGLSLFGDADRALLYDRLHPSPEGYALLGTRFAAAAFGPAGHLASSTRS